MTVKIDSDKIRAWRKERLWSQEKMAEKAGVSLRTIQRIENGGVASPDSAALLANAFGVDVNAFTINEAEALKNGAEKKKHKDLKGLRLSFGINAISFLIGGGSLLLLDLLDNPAVWWSIWPVGFWIMGLLAHGGVVILVEFIEKMKREMQELETAG